MQGSFTRCQRRGIFRTVPAAPSPGSDAFAVAIAALAIPQMRLPDSGEAVLQREWNYATPGNLPAVTADRWTTVTPRMLPITWRDI